MRDGHMEERKGAGRLGGIGSGVTSPESCMGKCLGQGQVGWGWIIEPRSCGDSGLWKAEWGGFVILTGAFASCRIHVG